PSSITDALGEAVVAHHARCVQFLDSDSAVRLHDGTRCLVVEVAPLVPYLAVRPRHQEFGPAAILAAALLASERLLTACQDVLAASEVARVGDVLARRERGEVLQADVEAHGGTVGRWRRCNLYRAGERDVPLVGATANGDGLDRALDR